VAELIRIGHANRKPIVSVEHGTDFSAGNRVRYELWETRSPAVSYYLALAHNINITQTAKHAVDKLKEQSLNPIDLTVLRPRPPRADQNLILDIFTKSGFKTNIYEYTYKDYIWDFCIDETLKSIYPPLEIPNYTDQSLSYFDESENSQSAKSARDFLVEELQKSSTLSAHLVVAPGGMGKTSLCLAVASKLYNRSDLHSSVILIQAESIKRYVAENGIATTRIDSIFQLYELHARSQDFELTFDRNVFELGFMSGNLIVIIDGLDEFVSLFSDAFNLDDFLNSLIKFHKELGSSSVLLTTRNSYLVDSTRLAELGIQRYELLGFDRATCEAYLSRRFRKYSDGSSIANRVQAKIDKVKLRDDDERVVPFFADIAATVAEDGLCNNTSEELEIAEDPTPYPSNNDLTDHIVHSVLKREQLRHDLNLSVIDIVQLLSGLVADFSRRWLFSEMLSRLTLLFDERAQTLSAKISLNPLLIQSSEYIELRYSFLASYFEVLLLIDGIVTQSLEREFLRCIARLSNESNEFRELKRFFSNRHEELVQDAIKLIAHLRREVKSSNSTGHDNELVKRSIASILNFVAHFFGGSAQQTTELVLKLYQVETSRPDLQTRLSGLYIHGDFPPMDFSNLVITDSQFTNYKGFLVGRFTNSKFLFCNFDQCFNPSVHTSALDPASLDQTCEIGDLRDFINLSLAGKQDKLRMVEAEAKKFLRSFVKGDQFRDNKKELIRFSTKVSGLAKNRFDRLVSAEYFAVKEEKEIATFYEISDSFRPSVRRLLTDNYTDSKMRKFFKLIGE
jgi:hypothetical protein